MAARSVIGGHFSKCARERGGRFAEANPGSDDHPAVAPGHVALLAEKGGS